MLALALLFACRKYVVALFLALNTARAVLPLLAVLAACFLLFRESKTQTGVRNEHVVLLLSVSALCSLIQFLFANPVYFCYAAPLILLALVAFLSLVPGIHRINLMTAGAFFILLAVFVFRPVTLASFAFQRKASLPDTLLALPRSGSLRGFPDQAARYQRLVSFVLEHSAGEPILAAPDCPEVYFLAGKKNPTAALF
jgi:hypothetical protein